VYIYQNITLCPQNFYVSISKLNNNKNRTFSQVVRVEARLKWAEKSVGGEEGDDSKRSLLILRSYTGNRKKTFFLIFET
jgi:hypothetical protein